MLVNFNNFPFDYNQLLIFINQCQCKTQNIWAEYLTKLIAWYATLENKT